MTGPRTALLVVLGLLGGMSAGCSGDTASADVTGDDGRAETDGGEADAREDGDAPPAEGGDADVDGGEAFDGACETAAQCQDEEWCNGSERCEGGTCVAGDDPCNDGIDCTVDTCDDELDRCYHTGDNAPCQDDLVCNGEEQCLPTTGCSGGTHPDCRDTSPCTIDTCDEVRAGCVHDPRDLDGDTFMTSDYGCDALGGTDCTDSDPLVHPDADEICDDIKDNDCDTLADFADPECRPPNDTCAGVVTLEPGVSVNSSTRGTIGDYTIPCNYSRYEDVTFAITLTETLDVIVDVSVRGAGLVYVDLERTCGVSGSSMRCQSGTTTSLRRNGLEPGTYYVIVQGSGGVDFSIAYRTEGPTPIPPNDVCAGATDIPAAGGVVSGTLLDTTNHYVPGCAGGGAYPDVFYRLVLTEPHKITVTGQLSPSSWNTYLSLTTACGDVGTEIACASGSTATFTRNFLDAGTYYIAVDADMENSFTLNVLLEPPIYPPANDRCPGTDISGGGVFIGTMVDTYRDYPPSCSTATLSDVVYTFTTSAPQDVTVYVAPLGAPVNYVAALRTTCDDRATEIGCRSGNPAQFTRRSLAAGTYYIVVSGPTAAPGNQFLLQLTFAPPTPVPGNDMCSDATDVSGGGTFTATTAACGDDYETICGRGLTYPDIVYNLNLAAPQDVTLTLDAGATTAYLDLRSGTCGTGSTSLRCAAGTPASIFQRNVPAGSYWILVDTALEAATTLDVILGPPTTAPCDGWSDIVIDYSAGSVFTTTVAGDTSVRTNQFTASACTSFSTSPDQAFRVVVPASSSVSFNSATLTYDGALYVRSTCDVATSELGCNDDCGGTRASCVGPLTLEPGEYWVIQDGYSGSGTFTLTVSATQL